MGVDGLQAKLGLAVSFLACPSTPSVRQYPVHVNDSKINDLSSFIYSHELYYIFFVVLNLYINNINVMGAPHLKLNHEHFC
jgi:hypothetical protein